MQDRYRSRYRVPGVTGRVRRQIAREAARRLLPAIVSKGEEPPPGWLDAASTGDYYVAKRKAAAVLGHRIRPGDLPSDDEVREELVALWRDADSSTPPPETMPDPDEDEAGGAVA